MHYFNEYREYASNAKSWFVYDDYLGTDSLRCMYVGNRKICYKDEMIVRKICMIPFQVELVFLVMRSFLLQVFECFE